ncbi:MAG: hypothetical protein PHP01_02905 [Phycisphaerae bacterium]|nr:hypothetical protein [Phycisphaerae bacterium]
MSDNINIEDKINGSEQAEQKKPPQKANVERRKGTDRRKFSFGYSGRERRSGQDRRDNGQNQ